MKILTHLSPNYSKKTRSKKDIKYVLKSLKSEYLTQGPLVKKFEIETRPFFFGLHKQPIFKNKYIKKNNCPNTNYISKYGLYLPTGYNLDKKKIKKISKITLEIFKKLK